MFSVFCLVLAIAGVFWPPLYMGVLVLAVVAASVADDMKGEEG